MLEPIEIIASEKWFEYIYFSIIMDSLLWNKSQMNIEQAEVGAIVWERWIDNLAYEEVQIKKVRMLNDLLILISMIPTLNKNYN